MRIYRKLFNFFSAMFVSAVYIFLYVPLIVLMLFSFSKDQFPAVWGGFTLDWYRELLGAAHLWGAFATSLFVAFMATTLCLVMTILLLFYLMNGGRMHYALKIFYVNLLIPELVLAVGMLSLFVVFKVELGMRTLVIAHTVLGLGYAIPITYQKFISIEPHIIDASLDLGATMWQTFTKIILPLMRPSLYSAALIVFILSFDDFALSYFCAGSSTQTLSLYIVAMLRSGISPVINALSTFMVAFSSLLVALFCYYSLRPKLI